MSEFIRKKDSIVNEASVHDSRIKKVKLKNDELTLELDRCSALTEDKGMAEFSPAYIRLEKFDKSEPMTSFRIFGKKKYSSTDFDGFLKMLKNGDIRSAEITEVFYRNIDILIVGVLQKKKKWKEFQLRLCYFGDMAFGYDIPENSP